uniref:Uncharacterized protein n=1 Tax=Trypanosoma vivax (strain Y486) TaxID=1055687 RepID=G0U3I6_TRYVY|nr:hypothetical protein TVY486_0906640 [Trypanosoma vivax Y486]
MCSRLAPTPPFFKRKLLLPQEENKVLTSLSLSLCVCVCVCKRAYFPLFHSSWCVCTCVGRGPSEEVRPLQAQMRSVHTLSTVNALRCGRSWHFPFPSHLMSSPSAVSTSTLLEHDLFNVRGHLLVPIFFFLSSTCSSAQRNEK